MGVFKMLPLEVLFVELFLFCQVRNAYNTFLKIFAIYGGSIFYVYVIYILLEMHRLSVNLCSSCLVGAILSVLLLFELIYY